MTWHIILTEPGRDLTAVASLVARGLSCYMPTYALMQANARNCHRRAHLVDRPLFPGYIFLRAGQEGAAEAVRASAGVRGWLRSGDGLAALSEAAMAVVRHVEQELNKKVHAVHDLQFRPGQRVRISRPYYPFDGLCGIIQRLDRHDRVILSLMTLGRAVSVSVATKFIAPLASA
jgi:transcription antitermination factor NusG